MKRFFYFLGGLLLLFIVVSIYQYIQYQEEFDALSTAKRSKIVPVKDVTVAHPPQEAYYIHHKRISAIGQYNPLLLTNIKKNLSLYDYGGYNDVLLDFYTLLAYRRRLLARADSTERVQIEAQIQKYSEQLCTCWDTFAQHMEATYPNMPNASGLREICASKSIRDFEQGDILDLMHFTVGSSHLSDRTDVVKWLEQTLGGR